MRDGIRIAVDVVRPVGVPGKKYPAVLEMTRYWRGTEGSGPSDDAKRFVRNGFAYIIGDVRGTGASFGKWPYHRLRAETLDLGEITGFSAEVVFRSGQDPSHPREELMKTFRKIASLTAVLVCTIAPSFGQHLAPSSVSKPTPAERAVIDLEHRWISNEYNPAFLSSILADDFVHVLPQGIITKQEQIAYVSTHPQLKFKVHRFLKLQVRSYGNTAIANGLVLSVPVSGPPRRFLFTDVFVLLNGHWQAVNSQENPASK